MESALLTWPPFLIELLVEHFRILTGLLGKGELGIPLSKKPKVSGGHLKVIALIVAPEAVEIGEVL